MNKAFFLLPILRTLNDNKVVRKFVALVMQAISIALLLLGIYVVVSSIRAMTQEGVTASIVILLILQVLVMAAMCVAGAQIFWLRAGQTQNMPETPYPLLPMASLVMRAGGETYAVAYSSIGILGCLYWWIAKTNPFEAVTPSWFPLPTDANPFLAGLLYLVRCVVGAAIGLLVGYLLAELALYLVDVLVHLRIAAQQSPTAPSPYTAVPDLPLPAVAVRHPAPPQPYAPPGPPYQNQYPYPDPNAPYPPQAQQQYPPPPLQQYPPQPGAYPPPPAASKCPVCGTDVTPGAPYCARCGNPLPQRPPGF